MRQPSLRQPYPLFGRGNRIRHWRRHHTKYNTIYKCNCRAVHNLPAHKFHTFLGHIRNSELGKTEIMILMMLIMLSSFISYSELLLEFLMKSFFIHKNWIWLFSIPIPALSVPRQASRPQPAESHSNWNQCFFSWNQIHVVLHQLLSSSSSTSLSLNSTRLVSFLDFPHMNLNLTIWNMEICYFWYCSMAVRKIMLPEY